MPNASQFLQMILKLGRGFGVCVTCVAFGFVMDLLEKINEAAGRSTIARRASRRRMPDVDQCPVRLTRPRALATKLTR
jgi:hypothetical protein